MNFTCEPHMCSSCVFFSKGFNERKFVDSLFLVNFSSSFLSFIKLFSTFQIEVCFSFSYSHRQNLRISDLKLVHYILYATINIKNTAKENFIKSGEEMIETIL